MVSYSKLIGFFRKFLRQQKGLFSVIFLLDSLAWPAEMLLWPYLLNMAVGVFVHFEGDRTAAWQSLQAPIIAGVSLVLFVEIASRTMGFLIGKAIPKLQAAIRMEMFDHVQRHSPHYFNERFAGNLANKITDMTTQAESIIQKLFWPIVPALVTCIGGTAILWFIQPFFGAVFALWVLGGVVMRGFSRFSDSFEPLFDSFLRG